MITRKLAKDCECIWSIHNCLKSDKYFLFFLHQQQYKNTALHLPNKVFLIKFDFSNPV